MRQWPRHFEEVLENTLRIPRQKKSIPPEPRSGEGGIEIFFELLIFNFKTTLAGTTYVTPVADEVLFNVHKVLICQDQGQRPWINGVVSI